MTYRTDNKIRKYVKGYGFMTFATNIGSKYGKKIINKGIAASKKFNQSKYGKIGSEFGKIAGKKILTKFAEATGDLISEAADLIGSKIADKITSLKVKDKPQVIEESEEIFIPADKRQQILNDLRLF